MERKKKQSTNPTGITTIKEEKEALKEMVPALALPNTANTLLEELEGLRPKWEKENEAKSTGKDEVCFNL